MCRVLAYIGPEIPLESLLLEPENSLINQTLDPENHPLLQLAGWGFGLWSNHLINPDKPLIYKRHIAAFYDDNAKSVIPSLQAHTLLAHVRAAAYNSKTVLTDENCHPYSFQETPWIMAQNGAVHHWKLLQRELLPHCKDTYFKQMHGTTDTEFLYVLLLSLLKGNSDEDIQQGFEKLLELLLKSMRKLDLLELTKLKIALVMPNKIIGVNYGSDENGETQAKDDWKALREGSDKNLARSMLLEPMYLLLGKNYQDHEQSFDIDVCSEDQATTAIFSSEPLTDNTEDWLLIKFGEMVVLEKKADYITKKVIQLKV